MVGPQTSHAKRHANFRSEMVGRFLTMREMVVDQNSVTFFRGAYRCLKNAQNTTATQRAPRRRGVVFLRLSLGDPSGAWGRTGKRLNSGEVSTCFNGSAPLGRSSLFRSFREELVQSSLSWSLMFSHVITAAITEHSVGSRWRFGFEVVNCLNCAGMQCFNNMIHTSWMRFAYAAAMRMLEFVAFFFWNSTELSAIYLFFFFRSLTCFSVRWGQGDLGRFPHME